jgi:hypothetical protein
LDLSDLFLAVALVWVALDVVIIYMLVSAAERRVRPHRG